MRRRISKRKSREQISERVSDVTLDQCANNSRKLNVVKSRVGFTNITKSLNGVEDEDIAEPKDENIEVSQKVGIINKSKECSTGKRYPTDIWYLIAKHIPPECLCTFSLICKDSYKVCLSAHFWKDLLKQFSCRDSSLPIDLFTDNDQKRGLRTRVIRILFYLNPALMQKIKTPVAPQYEPYTLQGMQLLFNWHEKAGSVWNYYFKLLSRTPDTDRHKNELFENPESDYRVLKVTSPAFICISYPQSCYLLSVHLGLTSDLRNQKLTLGLSDYTTTHCAAKMKQNLGRGTMLQNRIILEPITKCVVADWWHPEYPYPKLNHFSNGLISCSAEEW